MTFALWWIKVSTLVRQMNANIVSLNISWEKNIIVLLLRKLHEFQDKISEKCVFFDGIR